MKEDYPLVSIIAGTYNQPELTLDFLKSLKKITYPNYEVIIFDNASDKKKPGIVKEMYPEITLIENKENLGYGGGNNVGIRAAKGKYLLLINNDVEVEPDFLEPLVAKLEHDPTIAVCNPKIRFFFKPDTIQYIGFTPITTITVRNEGVGYGEKDTGQYEEDRFTHYGCGTAMLLPIEAIKKVGLISELFFLYYDELDWFQRFNDAGYKNAYVHNSLIFHKDSMTTGAMSPYKTYFITRNRILYLRRNVSGFKFYLALLYQFLIAVPKNMLVYLLKGQFQHFISMKNAVGWHFVNAFNPEVHNNISLD